MNSDTVKKERWGWWGLGVLDLVKLWYHVKWRSGKILPCYVTLNAMSIRWSRLVSIIIFIMVPWVKIIQCSYMKFELKKWTEKECGERSGVGGEDRDVMFYKRITYKPIISFGNYASLCYYKYQIEVLVNFLFGLVTFANLPPKHLF